MMFAGIDIGSNAVRLLISEVHQDNGEVVGEKTSLIRVPLRLGEDTFQTGRISDQKIATLIDALHAFEYLFRVFRPLRYLACATAALREAENRDEVLRRVTEETRFSLQIIDGLTEASLISMASDVFSKEWDSFHLCVDVGGGSTELSLIYRGKVIEVHSFKIGTVRILAQHDEESEWQALKTCIKEIAGHFKRLVLVGSGGNINKLSKLFGAKGAKSLSLDELKGGLKTLESLSVEERISQLGLRHDRADVIVPAAKIFLLIMKELRAERILIPRIGLVDGMVRYLYRSYLGLPVSVPGIVVHSPTFIEQNKNRSSRKN